MKELRKQLDEGGPLTDEQALETSTKVVKALGDRYSRVLTPTQAIKLGKYDVTGVGINLIIGDDGAVKVGAVVVKTATAAPVGAWQYAKSKMRKKKVGVPTRPGAAGKKTMPQQKRGGGDGKKKGGAGGGGVVI